MFITKCNIFFCLFDVGLLHPQEMQLDCQISSLEYWPNVSQTYLPWIIAQHSALIPGTDPRLRQLWLTLSFWNTPFCLVYIWKSHPLTWPSVNIKPALNTRTQTVQYPECESSVKKSLGCLSHDNLSDSKWRNPFSSRLLMKMENKTLIGYSERHNGTASSTYSSYSLFFNDLQETAKGVHDKKDGDLVCLLKEVRG